MGRILRNLCVLTLVVAPVGPAQDVVASDEGFGLSLGMSAKIAPDLMGSFSHFPVALRTVPTHGDDGWFGNPGSPRVIPDGTVSGGIHSSGGARIAPQYTLGRFTFRGGLQLFNVASPVAQKGTGGTTQSINQSGGRDRGVGRSLVYYAFVGGRHFTADPFAEIHLRVHRYAWLLVGASRTSILYQVENGYDRYDSLQRHSRQTIAKNRLQDVYVGARFGHHSMAGSVAFGRAHQSARLTPVAQDIQTQFRPRGYEILIVLEGTLRFGKKKRLP